MNEQARHRLTPNQVRPPPDCRFTSGCAPPRLTATQLPSITEPTTGSGADLHHAAKASSRTHSSPRKRGPRAAASQMTQKRPCVYILASRRNGTLYIGVTSDLALRIWQHRSNAVAGFVQHHGVHRLVFAEFHNTMEAAILREKQLKKWRRAWKLELIERHNPQWRDLYDELAV